MTVTLSAPADAASMSCPEWCARQDCAPDEPGGLIRHESVRRTVRGIEQDDPMDLELYTERWIDERAGEQESVVLAVPSEPGSASRYRAMIDLTPARALRLAALLTEYAALVK